MSLWRKLIMGHGISTLVFVNRTCYQATLTLQMLRLTKDSEVLYREPQCHVIDSGSSLQATLERDVQFDVRCNIQFDFSNGSKAHIRLNVPPKAITRAIDLTEREIYVDCEPSCGVRPPALPPTNVENVPTPEPEPEPPQPPPQPVDEPDSSHQQQPEEPPPYEAACMDTKFAHPPSTSSA